MHLPDERGESVFAMGDPAERSYVAPDGSTILRNVTNLSYQTTVRGKTTYVQQGDFYMSFSIIVTNP